MKFNFTIKKYSAQDFYNWEKNIKKSMSDLQDEIELQQYLSQQMKNFTPQQDYEYQWTFFRLYTQYSWIFMTLVDNNTPELLYGRQIGMIMCLDFDVLNKTIWYLRHNSAIELDMVGLYEKIKDIFSNSQAILGQDKDGQFITVADYYKIIDQLNKTKANSMEWAKAKENLANLLFLKNNEFVSRFAFVQPQDAVGEFFTLTNFFLGVAKDKIWHMVDMYINPELYNLKNEESASENENVSKQQPTTNTDSEKNIYQKTKEQVEAKFSFNDLGQIEDLAGLFKMLSQLSKQYNNSRLAELYYFDEKEGKFKWNEKLINS